MKSKKFLTFALFITICLSNVTNSYSIEPDVFVQSIVNRASKVLSENTTRNKKIENLKVIAKETVDIKGLAFYTLGSYRKGLNEDQKKQYILHFEKYFLKTFASRLAEYSNPEIQVNSKKRLNENYTMVSSTLVGTEQRPEVKIDWRIYTKNPNNPQIRDLIIEGLSLARIQKEEFSSIIENNDGSIDALFKSLIAFTS